MSKLVHLIGWGTLLGFGGSGLASYYFFVSEDIIQVFNGGSDLYLQLFYGLSYGLVSAVFISYFTQIPFLQKDCQRYTDMIKSLNLNQLAIFFLSLCAGVGEELFFRVALQPHWGIWITSVIFVAVHGYLNPKRPVFLYGFVMVFVVAGIGWLYETHGFWSATAAHFMVDFYLFHFISKQIAE